MFRIRPVTFIPFAAVLCAVTLAGSGLLMAQAPVPEVENAQPAAYSSSQMADLALPEMPRPHAAMGAASHGARPPYRRATNQTLSKLTFDFGGGFNAPHPETADFLSWGGQFNVGAGYNLSPYVALMAEYQFIDDKLPGHIIAETGADGGNAHIWSLTLNPIITLNPKSASQVYVTGGGGFYRKVTNFTDPVLTEYCGYYYCSVGTTNQVIGHFSSNQAGWSGGLGYQHRVGNEGRMKVYLEARYLDIDTPAVTTQPNGLGTVTVGAGTRLVPVSVGVRW